MVDTVFRDMAQAKKSATHVQSTRNSSPHIDVLPNTLDLSRIDEVTRTDSLPYNVIIILTGRDLEA